MIFTISCILISRGEDLLDSIRTCQPKVANKWAIKITGKILTQEGERLMEFLCPTQRCRVSDILDKFSLIRLLETAEQLAPVLCQLLWKVETNDENK